MLRGARTTHPKISYSSSACGDSLFEYYINPISSRMKETTDSDPDPIAYTTIHTEPEPNTTVVYPELDFEHDPEFTTVPDIFI